MSELGWWVIKGETLLEALRRANRGESPDFVYAELYANFVVRNLDEDYDGETGQE